MNEFTYHNMFETKGLEYIITIIFFLLLIPFWLLLSRKTKKVTEATSIMGILSRELQQIPGGIFVNGNHTWTFLEKTGYAKIGLDKLLARLTGKVSIQFLKNEGEHINKGDNLMRLVQDNKHLDIQAPLSGEIHCLNKMVKHDNKNLVVDPYGMGWVVEIKPDNWIKETSSMVPGQNAPDFLSHELQKIKAFMHRQLQPEYSDKPELIMQDGGELKENVLSELPEQAWINFQTEFMDIKQ